MLCCAQRAATAAVAAAHGATVVTETVPGYGAAVHAGVVAADTEIVCVLDGDGSMDPRDLPTLVTALDHADLAEERSGDQVQRQLTQVYIVLSPLQSADPLGPAGEGHLDELALDPQLALPAAAGVGAEHAQLRDRPHRRVHAAACGSPQAPVGGRARRSRSGT